MHGTNSICFFLLWVFFSLVDLQMGVTAEPTVTATILTPEADRKEGGQVYIQCVARNINSSHVVEWRTEDPVRTLRWGSGGGSHPSRFVFTTVDLKNGQTIQEFTINYLQRGDTDEYVCNVNQPVTSGGSIILATARVTLSVLYFPSESFPMCYPNGPFTKSTGTELTLQCSSEIGNPTITMTVSEDTTRCDTYTWTESNINGQIVMSLNLTLAAADDKTTFECTISSAYYPNMTRSCTIGPIDVIGPTVPPAKCPTVATSSLYNTSIITETKTTLSSQPQSNTAIIAGASAGGVAALVIVLILILICRRRCFPSNKAKTQMDNDVEAKIRHPDKSFDDSTEQMHCNPTFDFMDQDKPVLDNTSAALKPVAAVSPTVIKPRKPEPYKSKSQRREAAQDAASHQDDEKSSRPNSIPPLPPTDPDSAITSGPNSNGHVDGMNDAGLPSNKDVSYAQISVPGNDYSFTRPNDQPSSDHLVYADLDLQ